MVWVWCGVWEGREECGESGENNKVIGRMVRGWEGCRRKTTPFGASPMGTPEIRRPPVRLLEDVDCAPAGADYDVVYRKDLRGRGFSGFFGIVEPAEIDSFS